jgi:hypothetical protein
MKITSIGLCASGLLVIITDLSDSLIEIIRSHKDAGLYVWPTCVVACVDGNNKFFSPDPKDISLELLNKLGETIYMANLMGSGSFAVWPEYAIALRRTKCYGSWGYIDGNIGDLYETTAPSIPIQELVAP